MKRLFSYVVSLVILAFCITPTLAFDYYDLDERQLEGGSCTNVYSEYHRNQTFKMDHNVLTKISVNMKYRNGGNVTLTVKDEVTSEVVLTKTHRMGLDEGWEEFDLVNDALGYIVYPDRTYSIWIGTGYYPGTESPCWFYTSSDNYDKGVRRQGLTEGSGDFAFAVYGYTLDIGRVNPDLPEEEETVIVPDTDPTPTTPEEETVTTSDESDNTVVSTPDTSKNVEDVVVEETDEDVSIPELKSVIDDDVVVDMDDENGVVTDNESLIKIVGTADAGNTVAVIVGEKAYTATADDDGNWYVLVNSGDFEDGNYKVEAQSKNTDGKGSEKVELFTLGISTDSNSETYSDTESKEEGVSSAWYVNLWNLVPKGPMQYIVGGMAVVLFAGLIFLLVVLVKRKKKKEDR